MVNSAVNPPKSPHPYNHHIYSTEPPAEDKLTLSGFEGPEKLLEIWFRRTNGSAGPDGDNRSETPSSLVDSIHSASFTGPAASHTTTATPSLEDDTASNSDNSESGSFGVDSFIDAPTHPYNNGNAHANSGSSQWSYKRTGLRTVPRPVWEEMLDIVKCKVLSVINNEHADAYLLSESSMFVYPNRIMLKTCGTTTLLNAIPRIFEIARDYCEMFDIEALFYSRKAFLFPERQIYPHGKWGDEVAYLEKLFPEDSYDTSGYVVGKVNGDHWCLYTATPCEEKSLNEDGDELSSNSSAVTSSEEDDEDEVTLEIMMQELDPEVTKLFWRTEDEQRDAKELEAREMVEGKLDLSNIVNLAKQPQGINGVHKNIRKAERRLLKDTGIEEIYPCSMVDDFLFDPCGYSLNGLLGPYYWTIHVTPEDICSYASFETTIPVRKFRSAATGVAGSTEVVSSKESAPDGIAKPAFRQGSASEYETYEDVIDQVLGCFKPGKFSVTLFSRNSHSKKHGREGRGLIDAGNIPGFKRADRIVSSLGKWDLVFSHYTKAPGSKAAVPEVAPQSAEGMVR
ncbi:spermidine resistance protein [Chytriomyces hyalinus]|nr:spermidine resistance protein [Chytriomyces hyalinus]